MGKYAFNFWSKIVYTTSIKITLLYTTFGLLWIFFSDELLHLISPNAKEIIYYSMLKGSFFIFITAFLLFIFIKRGFDSIRTVKEKSKKDERLYKLISENTQDVVWEFDHLKGVLLYISPSAEKIFGYTTEEIVNRPVAGFLSKDFHYLLYQTIPKRINEYKNGDKSKKVQKYELESFSKNGSVISIEVDTYLNVDDSGNVKSIIGVSRDITYRKVIEKQLLYNEKLLYESQKIAGIGHYDLNIISGYWKSSTILNDIFGIDEDFVKDINGWLQIIHPEQRQEMSNYFFNEVISKKKDFDREYKIKRVNDNEIRWVHGKGKVYYDKNGIPKSMTGIIRDVTHSKKSMELIELLKHSIDIHYDGVYWNDTDNNFIYINNSGCKMLGYKLEELIGKPLSIINESATPEDMIKVWKRLRNKGFFTLESVHKRKDGSEFPVEVVSTYVKFDGKEYSCGFVRDISERKKNEEEIRKLSSVVEQSPVSIVITDLNGKIQYVNPKFLKITGFTFDELIGKNPSILKSGYTSKEEYKKMWDTILTGKVWSGNFHNKNKNGELFWESAIISPLRNLAGEITHFIGIKEDITDKVNIENELEAYRRNLEDLVELRTNELNKANSQLKEDIRKEKEFEMLLKESLQKEKELNELKTRFISTTSHEFRTPLTSVLSSVELIQRYGKKWEEETLNHHVSKIKSSIKHLTKLLDDILTLSRAETGKITFNPQIVDFYALCRQIIEEAGSYRTENHEFHFSFNLNNQKINIDPTLTRFTLVNLLSNAFKYSPQGGKISLEITEKKQELQISVSDNGIGIPEEESNHLFEPFYRCSNVGEIPGTGLGLSIIKRSVELQKGQISYSPNSGNGSIFKIDLPIG